MEDMVDSANGQKWAKTKVWEHPGSFVVLAPDERGKIASNMLSIR
jgi:hypothetical protein